MPAPPVIEVYFAEETPPIVCRSVAKMDAALDRLHLATLDRLRAANESDCPLAVSIVIPGFEIDTGLGADQSYVCVQVEPCDGEFYCAVGDEPGGGESRMFYGAGQDSYWAPKNMIPLDAAREAVRYFVEHQRRSPMLRWQDWAEYWADRRV